MTTSRNPAPDLPFRVKPHTNPRTGTVSWRVTGTGEKLGRLRINFAEEAEAEMICAQKNAEELQVNTVQQVGFAQTRLSPAEVAAAESTVTRAQGRWTLAQICEAGLDHLTRQKAGTPLEPLYLTWKPLVKEEVGDRWYGQLETTLNLFFKENPGMTLDQFNRARVRSWLDARKVSTQTKRNNLSTLHRFGGWLQQRFDLDLNPVAGVKLGRTHGEKKEGSKMPVVFTSLQVKALMWAVQQPAARRLKGWTALCLFGGLRPESEAVRLTWPEINLEAGEINVLGTKRGAKPRILKINPTLRAWIVDAQRDGEAMPGIFIRYIFYQARMLANAWLTQHHPTEPLIAWKGDIQRHTYASMRASSGTIGVKDLAGEMGTSEKTYYAHYKNPRPAAEVKAFWKILPLT